MDAPCVSSMVLATLLSAVLAAVPRVQAGAVDHGAIQLRVMATSVPVRAGPGGSYRELARVGMGQVFEALDRSPNGAWYRIRLGRGLAGWVLAELVWPFEIVDEGALADASSWISRHLLGQSRLADGRFALTVSGGALEADGLYVVRFGFQPSSHWLVELSGSQSAGRLGSLLLYELELLVTLGPWRPIVPFAAVGAGGATALPHREVELFQAGTNPLVSAGGGMLVALPGGIALRVEARQMVVFTPDDAWSMLAVTGGLMLTF